jgi:tetrahydromethanopterin S-methyltransferase subunit G
VTEAVLDTPMEQVARRMADLERLERSLGELRSCCHEGNVARECGILKGLAVGSDELAAVEPG